MKKEGGGEILNLFSSHFPTDKHSSGTGHWNCRPKLALHTHCDSWLCTSL